MNQELSADAEKTKLLESRLSDLEKGKLFAFNQDKDMVHAVEKALLYQMYEMGVVKKEDREIVDINYSFFNASVNVSNEEIGAHLRAINAGLGLLDDAFKQIRKFGQEVVVPEREENPAL